MVEFPKSQEKNRNIEKMKTSSSGISGRTAVDAKVGKSILVNAAVKKIENSKGE